MIDIRSNGFAIAVCAAIWLLIVLKLIFDAVASEREYVPPHTSQDVIQSFVKTQLDSLQARSFKEGIELCGFVYEDEAGKLDTTETFVGDIDSCSYEYWRRIDVTPVASYHTHGSYNPDYDDEAPSLTDMEEDIEFRVDGYISTPGGRLWHVDWQEERAIEICGEGCLTQDPNFRPCAADRPETQYTLATLRRRKTVHQVDC